VNSDNQISLFENLKVILTQYSDNLECTEDTPSSYNLYTRHIMKNKKPLYFGGVKINKSFVSYHLMPIYVFPELTNSISDKLLKCLKGKSCFNLKNPDTGLFEELEVLTRHCYEKYDSEGYLLE